MSSTSMDYMVYCSQALENDAFATGAIASVCVLRPSEEGK
jgi:hypothetical protein